MAAVLLSFRRCFVSIRHKSVDVLGPVARLKRSRTKLSSWPSCATTCRRLANCRPTSWNCIRRYSLDAHEPDRTTVHILNNELNNIIMINTFSQIGFRLNIGVTVVGSIVLFPQSVLGWSVAIANDINEESMSLFHVLEPKLDILVIGYGDRGDKINPSVIQTLSRRKIYVEALPTEQACTTYNFLVAEGRHVAAALIPPTSVRCTEDDVISSQIKQKKLFKVDLSDDGSSSNQQFR